MTVKWNGQRVTAGVRMAIVRGLLTAANNLRNTAVNSILSGAKTGEIYTKRGVRHQASAPGEPPASDVGVLANSINVLPPDFVNLTVVVNASAKYAAALEYGTQHIEPRPFMRPALMKHLPTVEPLVAREVRAFLGS